ncbi:DUF1465 family protein [Sphingomonas sp. 1P06PA]|uniref:DUF1465 family protein n=1 Tax=Sphingomonas sp. 1P06PA TaxID=554121 RepID=UPI0039A6A934
MTIRVVNALHVEAMLLADEVRAYFDETGRADRDALPPGLRVGFSCESLKVTTRLMHVIAWLLARRAVYAGELGAAQTSGRTRRLGEAADSDHELVAQLPAPARQLIEASRDLYARVGRLEQEIDAPAPPSSPARTLLTRLERAF